MLQTVLGVSLLFIGVAIYHVCKLIRLRKQLAGLPQPPMTNNLLGHLPLAGEVIKLFPNRIHGHCIADYIRLKYDLPEVFYIDWRPFSYCFIYVTNPELAAQYVTTSQSLPKSPVETEFVERSVGKNNFITVEGARWRSLRTIFNPGFSGNNIMTMADYIVDAAVVFAGKLELSAKSNEIFELEEYATQLSMDIIGKICLDVDMNCQQGTHPIATHFRHRMTLLPDASAVFPWQDFSITRPFKLWWNAKQLDKAISEALDQKIIRRAEEYAVDMPKKRNRSVVDLALAHYENEMAGSKVKGSYIQSTDFRIAEPSQLPGHLRTDLIASIQTFLFAGHDTSSTVISLIFYLLHRNPTKQTKLTAELNRYFPPGSDTAATIKADPYIINKLEYLTAVIKETMRIFPPAGTLRWVDPKHPVANHTMVDPKTGAKYPMLIPNSAIFPSAYLTQRNERFFPKPTHFIPERFIPAETPFQDAELFTPAGKEAFRAFEKGPRNCIGQELAMVELKIVCALTVRRFDFVLQYPGEDPDPQFNIPESVLEELSETTGYGKAVREGRQKRDRVEGHRVFPVLKGTAKPEGGCPGKVYIR